MKRDNPRGLALIVTVGILTLLALSATLLAGLAAQLRLRGSAAIDDRQARLLARSGVEYASARLFETPLPGTQPTSDNQADDWTYRDGAGVPLETAFNPSYAQTESYADLNGNGRYDPNEDGLPPGGDWNRNNRFDAWSGRLRSRCGAAGGTFALKVTSEGAKLDINQGLLSRADCNANGVLDYRDPSLDGPQPPLSPPVTHGYTVQYETHKNSRIAHAIDLLGQTLGIASPQIGETLIQSRPMGGYRSLGEARRAISPVDFDRLSPYLALASGRTAARHKRLYRHEGVVDYMYESEDRVPVIDLGSADPALLQALFTGLMGFAQRDYPLYTRMQDCFGLGAADARRVADFLATHRPFASRYELFRSLDAGKDLIFPADHPFIRIVKGDLAFANADPDDNFYANLRWHSSLDSPFSWPLEGGESFPFLSWRTYDLHRYAWGNGETRVPRMPAVVSWGAPLPVPEAIPTQPYKLPVALPTAVPAAASAGIPSAPADFGTLPLALDGYGGVFRVESIGKTFAHTGAPSACALDSAVLSVGDTLAVNSQAGFENLGGANRPVKVQTQTYPRYPLDSCADLATDPRYAFPGDYGAIALMRYAGWADGSELLYQPCWEVGQPLRKSASTLFMDNFRDEARSNPPDEGHARDRILQVYHKKYWNVESSGTYGYLTACPPGAVAALGFAWAQGEPPPWFDANGILREMTVDCWSFGDGGWACVSHDPGKAHYRAFGMGALSLEYAGPGSENAQFMKPGTNEEAGGALGVANSYSSALTPNSPHTAFMFYCDELAYSAAVSPEIYLDPVYHQSGISLGFYAAQTNHRVTLAIGSDDRGDGLAACYIDGIVDPGLVVPMPDFSWNPADASSLLLNDEEYGFPGRMSGYRLTPGRLDAAEILARTVSQPAYWNDAIDPAAPGIPHYRSPLHAFAEPVDLKQVGWEGFVPELIRSGTVSSGSGRVPLAVDLLAYIGPGGTGEITLPFPVEFWLTGGGRTDFKALWRLRFGPVPVPKVRGFRYRVWMDASQIDGFNNESPVFRSLAVGYRTRRRILHQE